jgi:hypothetical protein
MIKVQDIRYKADGIKTANRSGDVEIGGKSLTITY